MRASGMHPWVASFRDRIGFGLDVFPIENRDQPARHLLAAGELAERLGFDGFWVADHPAWGLDCWVHLAALSQRTERLTLGINVHCALYRNPVLVARQAADVDNLSEGRLVIGMGIGWDEPEFANLGLPFPPVRERQVALVEAITIMRGAWGGEPFSFAGRHFSATNARVLPAPIQQPGPPVLIAGGGEKVTLRHVARLGDACQLGTFGLISGSASINDVRAKLQVLDGHLADARRPREAVLRTHFTGWLILAEDEQALAAKVRRMIPGGIENRYSGIWAGFAVACTPGQAVAMYRDLVEAGIQYFVVGTLDATDLETVHLLAEQVIPAVRAQP